MVTITLYGRQQKKHRCIEQSFGLCGRGRGWDDLGEWHWIMYIIICETNSQSRFDAWYWLLGACALGRPRGMVWGVRWERGFRMGNTCTPMADSCWYITKPIQYCKVISLQLKLINLYKKMPRMFAWKSTEQHAHRQAWALLHRVGQRSHQILSQASGHRVHLTTATAHVRRVLFRSRVYMCSPSWTLLPPPSLYHPSGSSQCTSPKHPVSCINLDWRFASHMILYMFQCHSPKSSHSRPLPQSPKDCSIHLCLLYRVK